jgi:DNA-binding PadR family transcriptional regulator
LSDRPRNLKAEHRRRRSVASAAAAPGDSASSCKHGFRHLEMGVIWPADPRSGFGRHLTGYSSRVYSRGMSVPLALLGLLEREPSHGYDLKRDYDAWFGRGRPLPFGQVYATLGRLARDGKVIAAEAEPGAGPDRKRYIITEDGVSELEAWLAEPVAPEPHLQTVLFVKVVLALMSGRPAEEYLDTQRAAHLARMRELTELRRSSSLVDALLADHGLFHLEADLRWIDLTASRLSALAAEVQS